MRTIFDKSYEPTVRADNAVSALRGYAITVGAVMGEIMRNGGPSAPEDEGGVALFFEWAGEAIADAMEDAVDDMNPDNPKVGAVA